MDSAKQIGEAFMASRLHRHTRLVTGIARAPVASTRAPRRVGARRASLVINCNDSGLGSLRAAITAAMPGDTIRFQAGLNCPSASPILLTAGTLTLDKNLTIDGTGATIAVDGNNASSVFTVTTGMTVAINALTIQHGFASTNVDGGGGIISNGALTVTNSTFSGNPAGSNGGIYNGSISALTVANSTFSDNNGGTITGGGGGIGNGGTLTVTTSTFLGNIRNTPALLGSLGNYGGPTQTIPLLPGSPPSTRARWSAAAHLPTPSPLPISVACPVSAHLTSAPSRCRAAVRRRSRSALPHCPQARWALPIARQSLPVAAQRPTPLPSRRACCRMA